MATTAGNPRRRSGSGSQNSEDQALDEIAREAEAKLAAKRQARAEARQIRLKELERQQKEADEQLEKQYQLMTEDPSLIKRFATRSVSTGSLSTTSSRKTYADSDEEPENGPLPPERAVRVLQESLHETEEKYKKAMVSIAQLDNEKQALLYQVDYLKDRLEDEEELSTELKAELKERNKDIDKMKKEQATMQQEITELKEAIDKRDLFLQERGLSMCDSPEEGCEGDGVDRYSWESSNSAVSESTDRIPSLSDDKEVLVRQIKNLQEEVGNLRREGSEAGDQFDATLAANLEELKREFQRQVNDFKMKLQKAEQENARLEGLVMRLESQVKRYKSQAEAAEATEENLKAEKRKLQREIRKVQDELTELQTSNEHLQKRFDKLKSKRKDDT